MIVPDTNHRSREERRAGPTPLFEGWHHFVDQEFQAPVHGFRGQQAAGIELGGKAG